MFLFESWSVVHECQHTHSCLWTAGEREKAEEEGERALDKLKLQKQFNYFHILIILTSTSLKYVINIIDLLNQLKLIVKVFVYSKSIKLGSFIIFNWINHIKTAQIMTRKSLLPTSKLGRGRANSTYNKLKINVFVLDRGK